MKTTGMARKVDDLGRIVLPVEMRRMFGIRPGDELEIGVEEGAIRLRKIEARCVFCDATDGLQDFRDKRVCKSCIGDLGLSPQSESGVVGAALGHTQLISDGGDS